MIKKVFMSVLVLVVLLNVSFVVAPTLSGKSVNADEGYCSAHTTYEWSSNPNGIVASSPDFSPGDIISAINIAGTYSDPGERDNVDCVTATGIAGGMSAPLFEFYDNGGNSIIIPQTLSSTIEFKDFTYILVPNGAVALKAGFTDTRLDDNTGGCTFDLVVESSNCAQLPDTLDMAYTEDRSYLMSLDIINGNCWASGGWRTHAEGYQVCDGSALRNDQTTMNEFCKLKGYATGSELQHGGPWGNPGDNTIIYFDGSQWTTARGTTANYQKIDRIRCTGAIAVTCCDSDGDGFDNCDSGFRDDGNPQIDCKNNDNAIYPGATEVCNGLDDNCIRGVDEGSNICPIPGHNCELGVCVPPPPTIITCLDNQTIIKLFGERNSHGAFWDFNDLGAPSPIDPPTMYPSTYEKRICYEDIFGVHYPGTNPHVCTSGDANKVLGLWNVGNSHAEKKEASVYTNDVCYGDLVCHTVDTSSGLVGCNNNERVIASLFQETNSHVSKGVDSNYNYKVCCNSSSAPYVPQCSDGIDNDGDGLIDRGIDLNGNGDFDDEGEAYPDTDCTDATDPLEGPTQCNDGIDNDENGPIDLADPDCVDENDPIEGSETTPQCSDGIDNDGDGDVDLDDPDCTDANDPLEGTTQCNDNIDNDIDLLIDWDGDIDDDGTADVPIDPDCVDNNDPIEGNDGITTGEPYWADLLDNPINTAGLGSVVKMIVTGVSNRIEYKVKKDVSGSDPVVAEGITDGFWDVGLNDDGTESEGDYYFEYKIGTGSWENSKTYTNGILTVTSANNEPPEVRIVSPINKQMYFVGVNLSFEAVITDPDSRSATFTWDLGDGTTMDGYINFITGESANLSFNYSYEGAVGLGQKNIVLDVIDSNEESSSNRSSVLIINSTYLLAYIDNPRGGLVYGRTVQFDARSTYSVESSIGADGCTRDINCLAGNCPSGTQNCPACYYTVLGEDPSLPCSVPVTNAPVTPADAIYTSVNFHWIFDGNPLFNKIATGDDGVYFPWDFLVMGYHNATLNASINPSSIITTEFDVVYSIAYSTCVNVISEADRAAFGGLLNLGRSYWWNSSTDFVDSVNGCRRADGIDRRGSPLDPPGECCPPGYACGTDNTCQPTGNMWCSQLSETDCSGHEGEATAELGDIVQCNQIMTPYLDLCENFSRCFCEWNSTNNVCEAKKEYKIRNKTNINHVLTTIAQADDVCDSDINGDDPDPYGALGICTPVITYSGDCSQGGFNGEGYLLRSWNKVWDPEGSGSPAPLDCVGTGSDRVPCANVLRLNFFSFINVIMVLLGLICIYGYLIFKEKR